MNILIFTLLLMAPKEVKLLPDFTVKLDTLEIKEIELEKDSLFNFNYIIPIDGVFQIDYNLLKQDCTVVAYT